MTVFDMASEEFTSLRKENQELKKQLEDTNEELELVRCDLHNRTSERDSYYRNIEIIENQQKEFIEYLENEIYSFELRGTSPEYNFENVLKRILLKYKEIIGDDK